MGQTRLATRRLCTCLDGKLLWEPCDKVICTLYTSTSANSDKVRVKTKMEKVTLLALLAVFIVFAEANVVEITDENWRTIMEGEWMLKL